MMANPKYWRTQVIEGKSKCPWCGSVNNHRATATICPHVAKVQSNGTALYYWGFRPEGWKGHQTREGQLGQAIHILRQWAEHTK